MKNDIAAIGGAAVTLVTGTLAALTFGQVAALNNATTASANFTANKAKNSLVRHVGEATVCATGAVAAGTASALTLGQFESVNNAAAACARQTASAGYNAGAEVVDFVDSASDKFPGVGHVKGTVCYAVGATERGHRAMAGATRTSAVIGGGFAGAFVGGPVGAVAGGLAAGAAADSIATGVDTVYHGEYRPHGSFQAVEAIRTAQDGEARVGGVVHMAVLLTGDVLCADFGGDLAGVVESAPVGVDATPVGAEAASALKAPVDAHVGGDGAIATDVPIDTSSVGYDGGGDATIDGSTATVDLPVEVDGLDAVNEEAAVAAAAAGHKGVHVKAAAKHANKKMPRVDAPVPIGQVGAGGVAAYVIKHAYPPFVSEFKKAREAKAGLAVTPVEAAKIRELHREKAEEHMKVVVADAAADLLAGMPAREAMDKALANFGKLYGRQVGQLFCDVAKSHKVKKATASTLRKFDKGDDVEAKKTVIASVVDAADQAFVDTL